MPPTKLPTAKERLSNSFFANSKDCLICAYSGVLGAALSSCFLSPAIFVFIAARSPLVPAKVPKPKNRLDVNLRNCRTSGNTCTRCNISDICKGETTR